MFIIDLRNTRVSNYDFSVIGNNNVDVVHIYSHFTQYVSGYKVYLKVHSIDERYVDKIEIDSQNVSIDDGALLVKWTMGEVSTQCKKIELQLQFENNDGSIIAQSRIVTITLFDTINVAELIPIIYPDIIRELQNQINDLTANSGAKVSLGYTSDVLTINLLNTNNQVVDTKTITIPTDNKFVDVSFNTSTRIITFTTQDGHTKTVNLSDIYTKTEVNNLLANKVDKVNGAVKIYATDGSGNQTTLEYGAGAVMGRIPQRVEGGNINVGTPTNDAHATSKKYVDDKIASIQRESYKVVDITTYPTLNDFLASTGEEGYLYLYPIDTSEAPTFESGYYRYVWEDNAWLDLGTTQIDLSDYYTKTETDTLLGAKADQSSLSAHTGDTNNPHSVTKAQVGLGNVDNTSDQNKPVSTAQQSALDLKADKATTYSKTEVDSALAQKQNDVCLSVADGKLCITYEA